MRVPIPYVAARSKLRGVTVVDPNSLAAELVSTS